MKSKLAYILILLISVSGYAQNKIKAEITTSKDLKSLEIHQTITFQNTSDKVLDTLYLYDWINAFSNKESPLAKRYAQEFVRKFHFASSLERGGTSLKSLSVASRLTSWDYANGQPDIIQVILNEPLLPDSSLDINLEYTLLIPDQKFTGFGWNDGELNLNQWLIMPAILREDWILYSHKDLNDFPLQALDYDLRIELPSEYTLKSILNATTEHTSLKDFQKIRLSGDEKVGSKLIIKREDDFELTQTDHVDIFSDLKDSELRPEIENFIVERIFYFLKNELGVPNFETMLISKNDYNRSPVYGLNQLPSFIRPFPDGFQFDMKILKTITNQYLRRSFLIDTREDQWFLDALLIKLMMDYVETYYPDVKLLGSFSEFIGVRWFYASDLFFNDRYNIIHATTIRQNLGQPVDFPQDSLLKFNQRLSNPYKGGLGFKYLEDYLGKDIVKESFKIYFKTYNLKPSAPEDYFEVLENLTDKDISWFYTNYLGSPKDIDFKVKSLSKTKDSLQIKILNTARNAMPVPVYQLRDGKILSKHWTQAFKKETTLVVKDLNPDQVAVNYEEVIPEFNPRNNFKSIGKILNKPLQFRALEDIEDPKYNQVFLIPEFTYNLYDGLALGPKLYNTSLLPKQFNFKLNPKYGLSSNAVVGGASINYTHFLKEEKLFRVRYGINGSRFSYDQDLFYNRFSAFLNLTYRPQDLRDNARHNLTVRSINVQQEENEVVVTEEPNYNIFNIRYNFSNKNLDRFFTSTVDYQIAQKFSKASTTLSFRKLFNNNRQVNLRVFGGLFLYNDTQDSNFFSFGLDRPTDYLFDYNYYGRSEESGLFSQQFIKAEGGFKSQFDERFVNDWMATANVSTTIWNWIFAYADAGVFKNKYSSPQFRYDSGLRLSFVEDYFELYLPVYSSNGWDLATDNYDQRIRFVVSLDLSTLFKLFTRKWY